MKCQIFHQKKRCKNSKNFNIKQYTSFRKRKNRSISAIWGRFTTRNCAKESSHIGEKFLQDEGDYQ